MKNKILVVGGNFANTGAEAMTYVTIFEMKKRFPHCQVVMCDYIRQGRAENNTQYLFEIHNDSAQQRRYAAGDRSIPFLKSCMLQAIKNRIKKCMGKPIKPLNIRGFQSHLQDAVAVVDISGYALGSNWPENNVKRYTDLIAACQKHQVKLYFLPQSFGPFAYEQQYLDAIKQSLPQADLIFVREKEGFEQLQTLFELKNVVLSTDLVLQNDHVDYTKLLTETPPASVNITTTGNVAIIPNQKVFTKCDETKLLALYQVAIRKLLDLGKTVYIIRHSREDLQPAQQIKDLFADNDQVLLIETQFSSYQYEEIIQLFDYAIASRYHSIVHAYKHNVPCVALGWAVKYNELLAQMGQSEYMFDARASIDAEKLCAAIAHMEANLTQNKSVLQEHLNAIQQDNCFDAIEKHLRNEIKE